jgi:hypothetical protein
MTKILVLAIGSALAVSIVGGCGSAQGEGGAGLAVVVTPMRHTQKTIDPALVGEWEFKIDITNTGSETVYVVDDPRMPHFTATASELVIHWDIEDWPADSPVNKIFKRPRLSTLAPSATLSRIVRVKNPVRLTNYEGLWFSTTQPTTVGPDPSEVTLGSPFTVRAVVGYGITPFRYTSTSVPQDARLVFHAWQVRGISDPIAISQ